MGLMRLMGAGELVATNHFSPVTSHQSPLAIPLVAQLEPYNRRKRATAGRRRELRNLLTCFANRVVDNGVSRTVNDRELGHSSIGLYL